ncbi:RNA helicase [Entomortierella beljakovae]|nr:RNA helicase [Entomortierella beljakovae]
MDWHEFYNLLLAAIITSALISFPLAIIATIRLRAALPQHRPSNNVASRKKRDSPNANEPSSSSLTSTHQCTATIFLGSGGHTAEMLQLVSGLDPSKYILRHYVVGWDDISSIEKLSRLEASRSQRDITNEFNEKDRPTYELQGYTIHRIPRSRYVHQSMLTTPFTLAKSLLVAMPLIKRLSCLSKQSVNAKMKSVLLMNGPGTCFALALAVIGARMFGVPDDQTPDLVFIESFARVKTLSLAGKLLYPLCDVFLVQWPGFVDRYPNAETPRPKQRVVKEQKIRESRKPTARSPTAIKNIERSKANQWKLESGPSGSFSSLPRKHVSTSISVTSLEKGSRNPQYEHSFAPGYASTYKAKSARAAQLTKTGNTGRDKAAAAERTLIEAGAKRKSAPNVRGFVPVRFALKPIASDVNLNLVSNRKIPLSKYKMYAESESSSATGVQDLVFAKTSESVKDMMEKVANSRFQSMGLHPDVEKGVLEVLAKSAAASKQTPISSASTEISTEANTSDSLYSGVKPTEIQAMTIPASIDPHKKSPYTLCAAETGSGKTLAYLTPVLHQLKVQEDNAVKQYQSEGGIDDEGRVRALNTIRHFNQPRAIVLLPSRELVAQVSGILKVLSHNVKLRTLAISHTFSPRSIIQRLASGPVDIIVATPTSLLDYLPKDPRRNQHAIDSIRTEERKSRASADFLDENRISLQSLKHLVIDEADSMFDHGFGSEVSKIVKQAKAINSQTDGPVKITVVSATLPKKVSDTLDETLPGMLKITTPSLHKSLPGLHQTFLDLKPYFGNRPKAILDILAKQQQVAGGSKRKENTLIFCNTKHSCELLKEHLKSSNVPGLLGVLHGEACNRDEILENFTNDDYIPPSPSSSPSTAAIQQPTKKSVAGGKILICTDIASRGIDTTAVNHVILYDFPVTIVDYLHRVGRTARGGRGGRATSLVGRKDRNLAERIMLGIRMGKVLS